MTLCIAWIRKTFDSEELIFATDSCLSAGERWESGVKLFQLPRQDCLICFSGYTLRTYPLILNLINSLKYDKHASNQSHDINQLVDYVTNLFTDIIKTIKPNAGRDYEDILKNDPTFDFLFGGWSWKEGRFKLWKIYYSYDAHGFIPVTNYSDLVYTMIGDRLEEADGRLQIEVSKNGSRNFLDMEPFKILVQFIRESIYDSISGAVQFAKIYPSGVTEFFGVYYPSISGGRKTFLGRDVSNTNNPSVRFVDPDTGFITDLEIPGVIEGLDTTVFGVDESFVLECYPNKTIKEGLIERDREVLQSIFKEHSYKIFLSELSKKQNLEAINDE